MVDLSKSGNSKTPSSERKRTKRGRSDEGEETEAKWAKSSTIFDSPAERQIVIVDCSDPDGRMTTERWLEVEARILLAITELDSDSGDKVSFDGTGWHKSIKVVG